MRLLASFFHRNPDINGDISPKYIKEFPNLIVIEMANGKNFSWKNQIPHMIRVAENYKDKAGSAPTLRGLYYALVSDETIPNTKNAYKGLSRTLTKARKNGSFPWNLIRDETRPVIDGGDGARSTLERHGRKCNRIQESYIGSAVSELNDILESSVYTNIKKWEGQPKRVVILVEKEAIADAVKNFARGWNIDIMVMRGYASATSMKKLGDKLRYMAQDYEVKVLMLTDFDPSGEDIARYAKECLRYDFGVRAEFTKIGVTYDQIQTHALPSAPTTAAEKAKMMRDPRFKNWGYGFFRVEVDALLAIVPDDFKQLIKDAIADEFNAEIADDIKEQAAEMTEGAEAKLAELHAIIQPIYDQLAAIQARFED